MSKRLGDDLTRRKNAKKKKQEEQQAIVDQKFSELKAELKKLGVEINQNFVDNLVNRYPSSKIKIIEFLLQHNEKMNQPEFYRLKIWQDNNVQLTTITSMLSGMGAESAQDTYIKLFDKCFTQQGNDFIPAPWLSQESFIYFLTKALHCTRANAPESLQQLVDRFFEKDGTEKGLLTALKKYDNLLRHVGNILNDSGKSIVPAFDSFINELFVKQNDNSWHPSNSLQAVLDSMPKNYGKFLSCLIQSGTKAPLRYQDLIKLLFNEQDGKYTLKAGIDSPKVDIAYIREKIIETLKEESATIPKNMVGPVLFHYLAKALEKERESLNQGNIETPENIVLDNSDIAGPSNIGGDNNNQQAIADQKFSELKAELKKLGVEIDQNFVKTLIRPSANNQKKFTEFLLQHNEKMNQPEFYRLKIWHDHKIGLTFITAMINRTGVETAQDTYIKLFDKCFTQQGNDFIPAPWLSQDSFVSFLTSALRRTRADAPKLLQQLVDKFFEKDGAETGLFTALKQYNLLSYVGKALADSTKSIVRAFDNFIDELLIKQNDNSWRPSNSLQAVLDSMPEKNYSNFMNILIHSGANAKENYQNLIKLLFNEQDGKYTLKTGIDPTKVDKAYIREKITENLTEESATIPKNMLGPVLFRYLAKAVEKEPKTLNQGNIEVPDNIALDNPDIAGPSNLGGAANIDGGNFKSHQQDVDVNQDNPEVAGPSNLGGAANIDGGNFESHQQDVDANPDNNEEDDQIFLDMDEDIMDEDIRDADMHIDELIEEVGAEAAAGEAATGDLGRFLLDDTNWEIDDENGRFVSVRACANGAAKPKRSINECLFNKEDVDKFYDREKNEINREALFRTIEATTNPKVKLQLIQ